MTLKAGAKTRMAQTGSRAAGALLLGSCFLGDGGFHVTRAPDLSQGAHSASVFGVFKGGKMSPEFWEVIGPELKAASEKGKCEAGVGDHLQDQDPALFKSVDQDTKENGITPELLTRIAPHAAGDVILSISVYGQPPSERAVTATQTPVQPSGGRGGRGRGGFGGTTSAREQAESFEIALSLFSVKKHEEVAKLQLRYGGPSEDEAVKKFGERYRAEFPGLLCAGWNFAPAP